MLRYSPSPKIFCFVTLVKSFSAGVPTRSRTRFRTPQDFWLAVTFPLVHGISSDENIPQIGALKVILIKA